MSDYQSKRYYWLKLKEDFFKSHEIVILESMPNGYAYESFYLKLLLESISHEGMLRYNTTIPYDEMMLSSVTHMDIDIVRSAIKVLTSMELMEILDDGTYHMMQVHEMIGSETNKAEQMRDFRAKAKENKRELLENNREQCSQEYRDKRLEIIDKNKDIYSASSCEEIIDYLNEKTGKHYHNTVKNQGFIRARINEGYKKEDFIQVIDNKCADWTGTEYEKYLQPSTLFGTKFDNYLNSKPSKPVRKTMSEEQSAFLADILDDEDI